MRKKIVAGNWKMNRTLGEGKTLTSSLVNMLAPNSPSNAEVVLIPPYTYLASLKEFIQDRPNVSLGAQTCSSHDFGAYTGEISVEMLKSVGAQYVIVGHSERREYFNEEGLQLAQKISKAITANLTPIFCCGESLENRESGNHEKFIFDQIEEGLFHLSLDEVLKVVIAYEPIWAIGTGKTASSKQVQEMHRSIRLMLLDQYEAIASETIPILYGGSVKPDNARELFAQADVDGGLVGGASLLAQDFVDIANSF